MITATLVFLVATAYALSPMILGGVDPTSDAGPAAIAIGSLMAGLAALSAFPSAAIVRHANTTLGIALMLSPIVQPFWPVTALVIQVVTGSFVTGFSLLPRNRDRVVTGGGWRQVFCSPSRIDRIETSGI